MDEGVAFLLYRNIQHDEFETRKYPAGRYYRSMTSANRKRALMESHISEAGRTGFGGCLKTNQKRFKDNRVRFEGREPIISEFGTGKGRRRELLKRKELVKGRLVRRETLLSSAPGGDADESVS